MLPQAERSGEEALGRSPVVSLALARGESETRPALHSKAWCCNGGIPPGYREARVTWEVSVSRCDRGVRFCSS